MLLCQVGFGSGFKVNSVVWRALRSFKDGRHRAWAEHTGEETARMWADLEAIGVRFSEGTLPAHRPRKEALHKADTPESSG